METLSAPAPPAATAMKFTASSADLLEALSTVNGAVPSKSTLPILECILFEETEAGDQLRLSATDLEISIVKQLSVAFDSGDGDAPSTIAVPAKRLIDTLRALPDLPITFSAGASDGEELTIRLQTDQGQYKMVGRDGADYPDLPAIEGERRIELESALLSRAVGKTRFAVSKDALRPAMMGVYFEIDADRGRTVATDGHRLVRLTLDAMVSEEPLTFIVPEKAMALVGRVADGEFCTVSVKDGHVGFSFDGARVMARLIDETYPNYEAVIPDENENELLVGREALLAATERVGLYSSSMTNQIRLNIKPDRIEVAAEDVERSSEAHETVPCEYDSDPMTIGFNADYLTEVLSNIDAEEVVFRLSTPNRAGIVTPQDQNEGEEILMLIMPVMLNTYA